MKTDRLYRRMTSQLTIIGAAALTGICLLTNPANARWGGGYGGGGGYNYGGDGFGGGNPSYSSRSTAESDYNTNQTNRYNEANSMNQTRYNEASSMQNQHYQNESSLSHQQYNQASNLQSNSHYDPYGGCCGWSGGSAAGAAAVGMMGGMAMGAAMQSAATPQQPTTVIENIAPPAAPMPYGTTLLYLPPGATPTQVNGMNCYYSNGTYYRPVFNGSQVVYVASPM